MDGIPVQEDRHCGGDPHAEHQRIHGGQVLHAKQRLEGQLEEGAQHDDQHDGHDGLPKCGKLDLAAAKQLAGGGHLLVAPGLIALAFFSGLVDDVLEVAHGQHDAHCGAGQGQAGGRPGGGPQIGGGQDVGHGGHAGQGEADDGGHAHAGRITQIDR